MTTGEYVLLNAVGGAISGAVGAAVANSSDNLPVLKGALATGGLSALLALATARGVEVGKQSQPGLSGAMHNPRFP